MGKTRAYKHRLDKYYHLAHAVGYRSRAAFKLVQLNQQYDFLTNATCCLDLCASPGGWSQVAVKYMPVGSTVIAIDLSPIKPIPHVTTLQADITSPKTHAKVRKIMQGNRCDVVLNDGAPNVGASWITDSTNQLDLCLASVKFATIFLKKGGAFVTKVFRSEHYNSLLWVLHQFFEQVIPTKPKASRDTSAELFIVCLQFKAPTYVDPRMLDPQYVFSDLDELTKKPLPNEESIETMTAIDYTSYKVSDFLTCDKPLEILDLVNELVFDNGALAVAAMSHPLTIEEIKTLCKDLKVIGLADKKLILKWRRQLRAALITSNAANNDDNDQKEEEIDSDAEVQGALDELKSKRRREERAERKRKQKMRTQLIKRLQKNLTAPSANADMLDPATRFGKMYTPYVPDEDLSHLTYDEIVERNINYLEENEDHYVESDDAEYTGPAPKFANHVQFKSEEDEKKDSKEENNADDAKQTRQWFNQSVFNDSSEDDEDEDAETAKKVISKKIEEAKKVEEEEKQIQNASSDVDSSESEDDNENNKDMLGQNVKDFDALSYKLAKDITTSKHKRTELVNDSFNRYMHDDGGMAPAWFEKDEEKNSRRMIPLTKSEVAEWRAKMRAINEVETKRVVEARARKKAKVLQKLKASEEKAADIAEKEGLDERSKLRILEQIYAKGMSKLQQKEKIVVAHKRDDGKPSIPKGKGKVRIVDSRGKKDLRAEKYAAKRPKNVIKKKKSKFVHRRK